MCQHRQADPHQESQSLAGQRDDIFPVPFLNLLRSHDFVFGELLVVPVLELEQVDVDDELCHHGTFTDEKGRK